MSLAFFAIETEDGPCVAYEGPFANTVHLSCPTMQRAELEAMRLNREQQARDRITQRAPAYYGQRRSVRVFQNEDIDG